MIKPHSVEEILNTAKIEEVVGDFVQLKKRGVNMIGRCPFHNEKTPSFTVSPTKNIYKCFGCGKGGNSSQFMMEHEQMSFPEALRYLAQKYNIEIEETAVSRESIEERQLLDSLYIINEFAKDHYLNQLMNTDEGKSIGLSYFKDRGFREETIEKFGLGFAPNIDRGFTDVAIAKGYNANLLNKLGLTTKYGKDFFRNRVMFTIRNLSGKVIGFGGRILQKNVKAPKYINSPETEVYNKSRVLYGAYHAKKHIRKLDECIMVEGYTDVISLHQEGIENVV
ncbi:MAG: DNA primase, partial [Saprospiraceae bacterium]